MSSQSRINIGDYVQALAASQFLPSINGFVEREKISEYKEEECAVILNGWYMHNPIQWAPSDKIHPLCISMHINKLAEEVMLKGKRLDYFKQHEPIGCRDYYTVNILKAKGIRAYFSGCMTLTLGETYRNVGKKRKGIYFVDPGYTWALNSELPKLLLKSLLAIRTINSLYRKNRRYCHPLRHWCNMMKFYSIYSVSFDKKVLLSAMYISHDEYNNGYTNEELLRYAESLVKKYAEAEMVVTSRIHCALPCTSLETPVIYVDNQELNNVIRCRLDGLLQLFNVITYKKCHLDTSNLDVDHTKKLSPTNMPPLKSNWKQVAKELVETCHKWRDGFQNL